NGLHDVSDDGGRDGRRAGRQGRGRLGCAQQLPPGGRLPRDRGDRSDRRVLHPSPAALARRRSGLRERPPHRARGQCGDQLRRSDRRRGHRADEAGSRTRAHRGAGGVTATAPRMAAADRRRHLVETAIRLFTEGSYHGTTTAEIARAAGVSEPILYRHFASKRDLYLAALEHVWAKTRETWEQALDDATDACAAVEAIAKRHVSVRSPKLQLAELWLQALGEASEDPELRRHLRRHMREVHDFVADLIRRGQAQGAIAAERDADSEAWIMLAGGILGMVGRRVGLLDDGELQAIRAARLSWLRA